MALNELLFHAVTVRRASYTASGGERTPTYTDTAAFAAVQPMGARRKTDHGLEQGDVAFTLYFQSDPGVRVRDLIVWSGKTLTALGPAMDMAGQGRLYKVVAREID